jgi:demethylmenaquinone methyltransferase / 2-methoxy-6-polyprenyl-1,4-benzoquinol methylase
MSDTESTKPAAGEAEFGFRKVPEAEKARLVRDVFDSVASRYDLMNDLMSGGIHRLWKSELVDRVSPHPGETILDVAGGTGDIALALLDRLKTRPEVQARRIPAGKIVVCDINESMIRVGRDRAIDRGVLSGIEWVCGDAEKLPVATASIDAYTVAFGLRNVTHLDAALAEARRVLKPGGRFFCLEFSHLMLSPLVPLYDLYSFTVLPVIGRLVAQDSASYRYLAESIRRFPTQEEFLRRIEGAGFERARYRNLTGGIAALHMGWRL